MKTKKRPPMSEVTKRIYSNNRKKPSEKDIDEIFDVLREEGNVSVVDDLSKKEDGKKIATPPLQGV